MNRPIHVMHIIDSMTFGGAEVLLRDLARALLARDIHVSVCYNTHGPIAQEIAAMDIPITRLSHFGRVDPLLLGRIFSRIRQNKPDIVHTHLFKSDLHGRLAARMSGVPVVISTLHNCHNWARNPILGSLYGANARLADHLIAVSDEVRDYSIRYTHIDPKRTTTIANAIPLARFENKQAEGKKIREEFNVPENSPLLGIVARLTEQKDHDNFLHAAQRILQDVPEARFLIVGDGPLAESLKALAVTLKIQNSITFTGNRKDIPSVLAALDILVFSSRWEGLPVALLEGLASSLPVVATNVGGVPGVIQHGITGLLVPPSNPEALASSCLSLIKDTSLREKIAQAGYEHVQANYGMDGMVNRTVNLYQSLLQNAGSN